MASPENSASDTPNPSDDSSNASVKHGKESPRKQLTVTFEDVGVEVAGLGQSWGSDCLSVVQDLLAFRGEKAATRVWELRTEENEIPRADRLSAYSARYQWTSLSRRNGESSHRYLYVVKGRAAGYLTVCDVIASGPRKAGIWLHILVESLVQPAGRVSQGHWRRTFR